MVGFPVKNRNILLERMANLDPAIKNRGFKIFQSGGCHFEEYDPEFEEYTFFVDGNSEPFYTVVICLDENLEEEYDWGDPEPHTCDCIYFEENLECKHIAAALFYLLDPKKSGELDLAHKNGRPKADTSSPTDYRDRVIQCNPEDPDDILAQLDFLPEPSSKQIGLQDIQFGPDQLTYVFADYHYQYQIQVVAGKNQIALFTNYKAPYLAKMGLSALHSRLQEHRDDLYFLTNIGRRAQLKKTLEDIGIPYEKHQPEDLFEISFSNGQIGIYAKGPLQGLYHPEAFKKSMEASLFKINNNWDSGRFLAQEEHTDAGKYNAGIALQISSYDRRFISVKSIMGKGSKQAPQAVKTKLEWLEDPNHPLLRSRKGLDSLLPLIDRINALQKREKSDAHYLTQFHQLQELFEAVQDFPLFFLSIYNPQYYSKPRPIDLTSLQLIHAELEFYVGQDSLTYQLQPRLRMGDKSIPLADLLPHLDILDYFLIWKENQVILLKSPKEIQAIRFFKDNPLMRFTEKNRDYVQENFIRPLSKDYPFEYAQDLMNEEEMLTKAKRQLYISEMSQFVILRPILQYGEALQVNPLENGAAIDFSSQTKFQRNEKEEEDFLEQVKNLHPLFSRKGNQGFFYLSFEEFVEDFWFLKAFEQLKKSGVQVFGLNELKNLKFSPHPAKVSLKLDTKQDWFETKLEVAFGNNKVKLKDLKKAIEAGSNYVELKDGSLGILPEEWLKKFGKIFRSGQQDKETLRIAKTHFNLIGEIADAKEHKNILKEIEEKKEKLASFTKIEETQVPPKLQATLRHYQHEGLNWLNFLKTYNWGGILADDMGLGKTLQLIALICQVVEEGKNKPILVVAPTTLLFNWKNELEKFAPHLDYFIHHGQRYDDPKEFEKHDLILTSYGVVINDLELLRTLRFELIIADESQAIKNVQSLRHKAMVQLHANLKIALSGTPIENNIGELFAQMNFVNTGFFSSFSAFKKDYINKLKKENQEELTQELRKKVAPFILRRTKEEVLTELPDKTEEYLYCEMGKTQRKLYDAYRNEYRDYLLKKFEDEGAEKSKMYVLEGLTRLRQICDATTLVKNGEPQQESVKIDLLLNHITEKTGNHKILVFSQFVKMLELVVDKLEENQIPYVYLDGQTSLKEREKRVDSFQEDNEVRVFLISLKAGGTGLNLTAADYVYILDPWWNPATENQAIDRCYRMGQKKNVFAYRMVCKDTVEEKILELQEAKKKLSKEIIGEGDSILAELDRDKLLALFE